jgi:hypothetical protein
MLDKTTVPVRFMPAGRDRSGNGLQDMHFRKVFFIAFAALLGCALCENFASAKTKEAAGELELRLSLIDRFPPPRLLSAARDLPPHQTPVPYASIAQVIGNNDAAIRQLEARGFRNVTGLVRRGDNFIAQAKDQNGMKVRVVMNARTGEIVGLSRILKKK